MEASTLSHRIRFGRFEVDPESGELFKDGRLVRLHGQPVQILLMLLEKPGRLVTREELQQRLWPKDTFVDFDYGLNAAIKRLRESLGDSADEPLYIETLPRRGYRFIFTVDGMPALAPRLASPPSPSLILRLWQAVTQSPPSPPGAEGKTPLPAPIEIAAAATEPERPQEPVQKSEVAPRSLETGQRLGSYEVLSLLGKGGMGEVYMARDSRLDRQVALKVLPDEFTRDPERLARFEREAKLLASLNHPNVAAIYGLEEVARRRFLVLEHVEGETLGEWLERGPLPIEIALRVCGQIAEGLEAAHEKGIVHRDLKPANIKITPEEKVKILDFGLARAYKKGDSIPGLPKSPVITDEIHGAATIVGTAAYMSPEQAKGERADNRTDIWAFGCILYECLTGKRVFAGESVAESIAGILDSEPDWEILPENTPAILRLLLRLCLRKDPARRLHNITDARLEIVESLAQPASLEPGAVMRSTSPRQWLAVASGSLIVGALIGTGSVLYFRTLPVERVATHIKLEPGYHLGETWDQRRPWRTSLAIAPDGRRIVYNAIAQGATSTGKSLLYVRDVNRLEARRISGTEGARGPFWSPDGLWIGFWADGKLMKVAVDGGVPAPLCEIPVPFGCSWSDDGRIALTPGEDAGLSVIAAAGGKLEELTRPDRRKGEYSHRLPCWLPGGKGLLYTIMGHPHQLESNLAVLELKGRTSRVLIQDAADPRLTSTGHLLFVRRGSLMAVQFDLGRAQLVSHPVPVLTDVMQSINTLSTFDNIGSAQFSVSDSGSLVYVPGGIYPDVEDTLVWVDHSGKATEVTPTKGPYFCPRLSPEGSRIAYHTHQKFNVWIHNIVSGTTEPLITEGVAWGPIWKPDGTEITVGWFESGSVTNLYDIRADGTGKPERLTTSENTQVTGSWSPDGAVLAFTEMTSSTVYDIMLFRPEDRSVKPFRNGKPRVQFPELSPDGRWIAFTSDHSGREEVYVTPFPGPGPQIPVSVNGGWQPFWARSGKQLFFKRGYSQLWAVDVTLRDPTFRAGRPRLLFEDPAYSDARPNRAWDISLDDRLFLNTRIGGRGDKPLTDFVLVTDWFEELKRLCPTSKN